MQRTRFKPGRRRKGYFDGFGGQFVPEVLIAALDELEKAFRRTQRDPRLKGDFLLQNIFDWQLDIQHSGDRAEKWAGRINKIVGMDDADPIAAVDIQMEFVGMIDRSHPAVYELTTARLVSIEHELPKLLGTDVAGAANMQDSRHGGIELREVPVNQVSLRQDVDPDGGAMPGT